jgi:hypothetical protein
MRVCRTVVYSSLNKVDTDNEDWASLLRQLAGEVDCSSLRPGRYASRGWTPAGLRGAERVIDEDLNRRRRSGRRQRRNP